MKLTRTIAYAIHATVLLARGERNVPIPCSQLAREGGLPERFLLQVLRNLVNRGVLHSTRGVDGGYYLARPPTHISILQIIEAFENPLDTSMPALAGMSSEGRALILAKLRHASDAARYELQKLTIADLISTANNYERTHRIDTSLEGPSGCPPNFEDWLNC
jgi:Rrf2 family transcriptional regulator, cysteine metabolism repressor